MKQKNLWLLVGIPGSGKSTWVQSQLNWGKDEYGIWISRDAVRFSIIGEKDDYFSKEKEVFNTFIQKINNCLAHERVTDVYIDATHINEASREKVLRRLNMENVETVNAIIFDTPLEVCLERNAQRTGRACVPETAIRNMHKNFTDPAHDKRKYNKIIEIGESF